MRSDRTAGPVGGERRGDRLDGGAGHRARRRPRLLELPSLAEDEPPLPALTPCLTDPDPTVRRTAVTVLTETVPPGTGPALATALADTDTGGRGAAAAPLSEPVETPRTGPARRSRRRPVVQNGPRRPPTALDALRLGDTGLFAGSLSDAGIAVRVAAVRALVPVDAAGEPVRAA